ncbi:ankyrin repeat and SOCS box protein 3-like [Haliotis cracherodii]|uniref:ankyrin repeat and SOCS box protein 3-like n=1 Tax=Haliotis cracherodii TaxID=6455 RepID=UPI0039ED5F9E
MDTSEGAKSGVQMERNVRNLSPGCPDQHHNPVQFPDTEPCQENRCHARDNEMKPTKPSLDEWNELTKFIRNNNLENVRLWFESRGLGSNAKDLWNINSHWPLQTAAETGCVAILDALLEYGFDASGPFFGNGLVQCASTNGHVEMIRRLSQLGLPLTSNEDYGFTHLHYAAKSSGDNSRAIQYLKQRGIDPNSKNWFGETALHVASGEGSIHNVHALIEAGASVNIRTTRGISPLYRAINRDGEVLDHVETLLEAGAVSLWTPSKYCEFHAASKVKNLSVISLLVSMNFYMTGEGCGWEDSPLYNLAMLTNSAREHAIDITIRGGYDIKPDLAWILDDRHYPAFVEKEALRKQLMFYATNPMTLVQMSCVVIRKVLGPSLPATLPSLPLPERLRDCVRIR